MPKVSRQHQDLRRNQIIEAAVKCIAKKGFHHTSMQDIVSESGLSPGAIYLYFRSKEEIIQAVAGNRHAAEREIIADAFGTGDTTVALNQLIETFFNSLADKDVRMERSIGVQLWGEALSNPQVRDIVRRGIEEPKNVLTEVLTAYQKQGKLPSDLSPEAMARVMLAQFQGFVLQIALDDQLDIKEYIQVIKHMISDSSFKGKQNG
jgi:AcrR family transcriptional regulator